MKTLYKPLILFSIFIWISFLTLTNSTFADTLIKKRPYQEVIEKFELMTKYLEENFKDVLPLVKQEAPLKFHPTDNITQRLHSIKLFIEKLLLKKIEIVSQDLQPLMEKKKELEDIKFSNLCKVYFTNKLQQPKLEKSHRYKLVLDFRKWTQEVIDIYKEISERNKHLASYYTSLYKSTKSKEFDKQSIEANADAKVCDFFVTLHTKNLSYISAENYINNMLRP